VSPAARSFLHFAFSSLRQAGEPPFERRENPRYEPEAALSSDTLHACAHNYDLSRDHTWFNFHQRNGKLARQMLTPSRLSGIA